MTKGRNLVLVVMVALALALTVPTVAKAESETVGWSWSAFTERLSALTTGVQTMLAMTFEASSLVEADDEGQPDGDDQMTAQEGPTTGTNGFPLIDPDG